MIKKYVKKPIVIEAVQWDGSYENMEKIKKVFGVKTMSSRFHVGRNEVSNWSIGTLEGSYEVSKGDYIIKGVKGEFYPCKPDIFEMTYKEVSEEQI